MCAHKHLPGHVIARLQCNDALIYGSVLPMEKIKFRRWISLHPDMGVQIDCNTPLGELAFCVVRCGSSTGVLVCVPGKRTRGLMQSVLSFGAFGTFGKLQTNKFAKRKNCFA